MLVITCYYVIYIIFASTTSVFLSLLNFVCTLDSIRTEQVFSGKYIFGARLIEDIESRLTAPHLVQARIELESERQYC